MLFTGLARLNDLVSPLLKFVHQQIDQFLLPLPTAIVTPSDYKSQTMRRLHEAFKLVKTYLAQAREQQKTQYDKRVKQVKFNKGDKVLLDMRTPLKGISKKLIPHFIGPFRILTINDNNTVVIQQNAGKQAQLVHINRIKPLFESMIWKNEPLVDFLDTRISKEANKLLLENVTNLETPFPFDGIESQPSIESETIPLVTKSRLQKLQTLFQFFSILLILFWTRQPFQYNLSVVLDYVLGIFLDLLFDTSFIFLLRITM